MIKEEREKAIKALKWFKEYNEEDYCGGDRIQDEHGDWYYRITEQDFEAFDMAIKALEQEPTNTIDYRRAFKIACDLLNGDILYGVDIDKIYELMMKKDEVVSSSSYEEYILNHLQDLDQGQYANEPATKNDSVVDCIDRAELLKAMDTWDKFGYTARYRLKRLDKDDKDFVPYVKYDDMVNCVKGMPSVTPQYPRKGYLSIDDVMSVFDDFMCGEVDEDGTKTFLEMLKDRAESGVNNG